MPVLRCIAIFICIALPLAVFAYSRTQADSASTPSASTLPPPVQLTAQQDLERMMALLNITSLRPGADGFNKSAPNYQNVDEAKANPYPVLPNPLILNDGKPVTSAKVWWKARRPQIVQDFNEDVYGFVPKHTPKVDWRVASVDHTPVGGIPVVTKTLVGHVDNSSYPLISVDIKLTLTTPAKAKGPVPVMMEFGFDPAVMAAFLAQMKARGIKPPPRMGPGAGPTWQEQVLQQGWGYAILDANSIQADNGAGLTQGIIGLCNKGQPRQPDQWGALRAWAWGASRALDYFETDKDVNAKEVGIEGVSRYGKATLVTMAYDPRFAIAFVGSSGEGGAKLWRRHWGEEEGNICSSGEYHWMCGNFLKYDGPLTVNDLPVDQHELIAMCAPRPCFIRCGSPLVEGTWLDDKGMFMATVAAGPVYRLLGKKALPTDQMPPMGTPLIGGDLAWSQHTGGHTDGPNWPVFIKFASRYFHTPG